MVGHQLLDDDSFCHGDCVGALTNFNGSCRAPEEKRMYGGVARDRLKLLSAGSEQMPQNKLIAQFFSRTGRAPVGRRPRRAVLRTTARAFKGIVFCADWTGMHALHLSRICHFVHLA